MSAPRRSTPRACAARGRAGSGPGSRCSPRAPAPPKSSAVRSCPCIHVPVAPSSTRMRSARSLLEGLGPLALRRAVGGPLFGHGNAHYAGSGPDILSAPMSRPGPTIVVIGGGFSGTAVATHLLLRGAPARIVLVNRYGPIGRGVAYGTRIEAHVLNVPAGGMSAVAERPGPFRALGPHARRHRPRRTRSSRAGSTGSTSRASCARPSTTRRGRRGSSGWSASRATSKCGPTARRPRSSSPAPA